MNFRETTGCTNNGEDVGPNCSRAGFHRVCHHPTIFGAGFWAMRLAQRLLDPVPAGNCKLQTLRQYYRLPERGAHTALGDVATVADLFATVLRPIAEQRGLQTWEQLAAYAGEEWYPSRIAFGKHKGKSLADAGRDAGLREWLEGLAKSANERNARMGRWYLRQLREAAEAPVFVAWESANGSADVSVAGSGLVVYVNPELQQLRALVEAARHGARSCTDSRLLRARKLGQCNFAFRREVSRNAGAARRGRDGAGAGGIPSGARAWSGDILSPLEQLRRRRPLFRQGGGVAARGVWSELEWRFSRWLKRRLEPTPGDSRRQPRRSMWESTGSQSGHRSSSMRR